jgi:hypothetical protein
MNFRITLAGVMIAMLAVPAVLKAQDTAVQEKVDYKKVVADYIEATGGETAHRAIKSITAKGTISIPAAGLEGQVEMAQTAERAWMKMTVAGIGEQRVGHDGETVWQISQMTGPEIVEGARRDQILRQMALSPLLEIEEKYDTIECTGVEQFAGEDCYVVKMQEGDSDPVFNYFSVKSKLLLGNKMTAADPMVGKMEIVSKQSDYQDVSGVLMSHATTVELPQGMQMITKIDSFETNGEIDEKLFELPEEIKELKGDKQDEDGRP